MDILLANPRGFCAGVDRAIIIVEQALEKFGAPIYVRHEVVHNKFVVDELKNKGAIFIDELSDVPQGNTVIFSAHGVSKEVRAEAEKMGLRVFDATCPLVTKVHIEVEKMRAAGKEIVMIGHKGHPEVEGTMGQSDGGMYLVETPEDVATLHVKDAAKLAYVTQTTLSIDDAASIVSALKKRFPEISAPKSDCDLVIVVGSPNSSNSNRLREVAQNQGVESYMVDNASFLEASWVIGKKRIGVSAGASAPEVLVKEVIAKLQALTQAEVTELQGVVENVVFQLPKNLKQA
jgi:4-hydroxy-3-methylbut-2-enyl diphosphate reductase